MSSKKDSQLEIFNKWEINFLLTLIILLAMAIVQDLGVSFENIIIF